MSQRKSFLSRIRSIVWPVYGLEVRKFFPMLIMLALICFNYSLLKNMKDALVITARDSGAEVIPFIKVWGILPGAILLTYFFHRLSNRFSQHTVFYIMTSGFLIYYLLFTFILYPNRDHLHPHALADYFEKLLPLGCKGMVAMFRNWTFTTFYIFSELWASMILSLLFWSFANQITDVSEAARFYGILHIGSNIATSIAGEVGYVLTQSSYNPLLPFGSDAWEQTLIILVSLITIGGLITMFTYHWVEKNVLRTMDSSIHNTVKSNKKDKPKYSLRESISYLARSRYILCIAIVVIAYNLTINLVEVAWKDQVKLLYPESTDYNRYMSKITIAVGAISATTSLFLPITIRHLGWTANAIITPAIMLIAAIGFFANMLLPDQHLLHITAMLGTSPLIMCVFFGAAHNCLSKASKYSLFDSTKEIAFIPLDSEAKIKAKAAIDGIGSRLAKSGGALIQQSLLVLFGTLSATIPYVALIVVAVTAAWITATRVLGREFHALTVKQSIQDADSVSSLAATTNRISPAKAPQKVSTEQISET